MKKCKIYTKHSPKNFAAALVAAPVAAKASAVVTDLLITGGSALLSWFVCDWLLKPSNASKIGNNIESEVKDIAESTDFKSEADKSLTDAAKLVGDSNKLPNKSGNFFKRFLDSSIKFLKNGWKFLKKIVTPSLYFGIAYKIDDILEKVAKDGVSADNIKKYLNLALKLAPVASLILNYKDVKNLFRMIISFCKGDYKDISILTWVSISIALIYLVSPIDIIQDSVPYLGFLDDAIVIHMAVRLCKKDIEKYLEWEKYNEKSKNSVDRVIESVNFSLF